MRAGDTLEGIARAMWGDAMLWYLIADANGIDGQPSAPLVANTVLTIPNRVTNVHNTSDTFRPYDAGKAMGDTSPTLPIRSRHLVGRAEEDVVGWARSS
ncbi:hypothetical protein ACFJIS_21265 [Variovorax boronicumulans]|uniref:hypothetical protein n=1 Tax=Variovorax boronicumulans TaxID=436515 RepID=UPI0036F26FE6